MSQGPSQSVQTSCPGCGKTYAVSPDFVGRQVKCQACQHTFQVVAAVSQVTVSQNPAPQNPAPQNPASQRPTQNVQTACPRCAKSYSVPPHFAGRRVKCQACQHTFQVAVAQPTARAPVQTSTGPPAQQVVVPPAASNLHPPADSDDSAGSRDTGGNCAICQSPIALGEPATQCRACSGAFHTDCWEYNNGCGIYGCSEAPPTESLNTLEIPASHWGQENKRCPACSQVILAAAVRCKHCGATFESAKPQDHGSFQEHETNKAKLPLIKVGAIVLLVFSLLPCTAPLAAIAGPIWYAMNRKSIAMLPGFHSALCKIAVGVSISITLMLFGVTILNLLSS